jgi:hypothetical protein
MKRLRIGRIFCSQLVNKIIVHPWICQPVGVPGALIQATRLPLTIRCLLIAVAQSLELDVVAEGVETEAQLRAVAAAAQGYLFSRSLDSSVVSTLLKHSAVPMIGATFSTKRPSTASLTCRGHFLWSRQWPFPIPYFRLV